MTITIQHVVDSMHEKIKTAEKEIQTKYKVKIEMKELLTLADTLGKKTVGEKESFKVIEHTAKEALEKFNALKERISKMSGADVKGIYHSLVPLHDYLDGVSHQVKQRVQEESMMAAKKLELQAKHERERAAHAAAALAQPTTQSATLFPAPPKELKLKDEKAKKVAKVYAELNVSPHAASLTSGTIKHNEQVDTDILTKLNHAKLALGDVSAAHEREALSGMHNHKVDQLVAHYTQVVTKCKKTSTGDSAKETAYYTTCIHKLGQAKVEASKLAQQSHKK